MDLYFYWETIDVGIEKCEYACILNNHMVHSVHPAPVPV